MRTKFLVLVAVLLGCGGESAPARLAASPVPTSISANPAPSPTSGSATLARAEVRSLVARGLGAFLQRVELEDRPVVVGGKFHGFRIVALRGDAFWRGVDLHPGDVVTSINGLPIERPEQALTAFESLGVASELRVAYERDGKPREIVYAIADRAEDPKSTK